VTAADRLGPPARGTAGPKSAHRRTAAALRREPAQAWHILVTMPGVPGVPSLTPTRPPAAGAEMPCYEIAKMLSKW
jgi:hypothetical protein